MNRCLAPTLEQLLISARPTRLFAAGQGLIKGFFIPVLIGHRKAKFPAHFFDLLAGFPLASSPFLQLVTTATHAHTNSFLHA